MYIGISLTVSIACTDSSHTQCAVESCSMDTLRNAVKIFIDLELLVVKDGEVIAVQEPAKLLEATESLGHFGPLS